MRRRIKIFKKKEVTKQKSTKLGTESNKTGQAFFDVYERAHTIRTHAVSAGIHQECRLGN